MKIVLITGLAGAGKSTAVKAFEDLGYYCIDNLPISLLRSCLEVVGGFSEQLNSLALVLDARNIEAISSLPNEIKELRKTGRKIEVLFLDAEDKVLLRRFSTTRQVHPISSSGSVIDGIERERSLLEEMREVSDLVLNTSSWNVHQTRHEIFKRFSKSDVKHTMKVSIESFGFRNGVPLNADLVFDVRFLKNPFFVEELKEKTGEAPEVASYVLEQDSCQKFLSKVIDLLSFLIPQYEREGRSYLSVAIGCTGGKHRSVAIAAHLAKHFQKQAIHCFLAHRDKPKIKEMT